MICEKSRPIGLTNKRTTRDGIPRIYGNSHAALNPAGIEIEEICTPKKTTATLAEMIGSHGYLENKITESVCVCERERKREKEGVEIQRQRYRATARERGIGETARERQRGREQRNSRETGTHIVTSEGLCVRSTRNARDSARTWRG